MVKEITDEGATKAEDLPFLAIAEEMLDKASSNLQADFGVAQGALRAFFNGIGNFVSHSAYLSQERKNLLKELNEQIFQIRNDLVRKVEVERMALEEAVSSSKAYERLAQVKKTFKGYIDSWYKA